MSQSLLNENQKRHVATHVHLLLDDIAQLRQLAELSRPEASFQRLCAALDEVEAGAQRMVEKLDLPPRRVHGARQHIQAAANVWATRVHELGAKQLRAYGPVRHDLADRLDPLVNDLRRQLLVLGDAALALPD
jgi:hypothetical protein